MFDVVNFVIDFQSAAVRIGLVEVFSPNFTLPGGGSGGQSWQSKADRCFGDVQYKHICEQMGLKHLLVTFRLDFL